MPKPTHDPQFLDPDHEAIVTFADTYFDDDEERESFIETLMDRRGYLRTTGWSAPVPAEPEPPAAQPAAPGPAKPKYFKRQ
jgi:hypothetical protein